MANYREIFEKLPDGITLHDASDGSIVETNERFCEMLGYAREEVLTLDFEDLHPNESPYTSERAREYLQKAATEGPQTFEWIDETKDGDELPVEVTLRQTSIDGDKRILAVVRDIRERREREHELTTQKAKITALHEAAAEIVNCREEQEIYMETVGAAERILELHICCTMILEDGMLRPKAVSSDAPPDGSRPMRPDEGGAGHVFQTGEARIIHDARSDDLAKPAKDTYRSSISVPIGDVGVFQAVSTEPNEFSEADLELIELLVAHTRDALARLKRTRELEARTSELNRQNERLERFASIVSHDLRNPLTVAAGRLELAASECESVHLESVADALDRIEALVEDTLALARQGQTVGETEPIELQALIEESWHLVSNDDATLDLRDELTVEGDPTRLKQVFENLFRNAIEHVGADVTVRVGAIDGDGFYVSDDGPGIPAEHRERIFETGYSTVSDGTGFGLAIVRDIVEAHGWEVRVTEGTDGGARFEITADDLVA